jgi:hypothetical protein
MAESNEVSAKYVYGVIRADGASPPKKSVGIDGQPLGEVVMDGLAALTSDVDEGFSVAGREELLAHMSVLEEAMGWASAVLPVRFGVVLPDADAVRNELLGTHREQLEALLEEMTGKVEVNLKGIHEEDTILREVLAESPEAAALREAIQGKPEEATYYERIRLGELISQGLEAKRDETGPAIVERLSPFAVAVQLGDVVHERMALNASFLIERDELERFDSEVDRWAEEQGGRVRLKYTGPLPPHSFVELEVGG